MLTIGLTGDVGAGKSTLCRVWSGMGATVLDADTVARDMW
jgi:dephospho-CoA kinase